MNNGLFLIMIFLSLTNGFAQNDDRTYLARGNNHGINHPYGVSELIIHSDSTFTLNCYNVEKTEWKNYATHNSVISINGIIIKKGQYYILIEKRTSFRNNNYKGKSEWITKISEKSIEFYTVSENSKYERGEKYKRTKASG